MFRISRHLVLRAATVVALTVPSVVYAQSGQAARADGEAAAPRGAARAAASAAPAAATRDVRQLGGSTRFYRAPLTTVAGLRQMSSDPRTAAGLRAVLAEAGVPQLSDAVVSTLGSAGEAYAGVACLNATPEAGTIVVCDVRPGDTMAWMAFRPGGGDPTVVRNVRWAGRAPFRAYLFRLTEADRTYTFVVPQECGNVSLLEVRDTPTATRAAAAAPAPPPPPPPPPAPPAAAPAPAAPPVAPPPPPPPPQDSSVAVMQSADPVRPFAIFADGLFGKERRVRPLDGDAVLAPDGEFAQCTPLVGAKLGVARRFDNDWEVAGAAGVAFALVDDSEKVREHALFIDVEANRYLGRAFVGGGLTFWDVTRSDTFTPGVLVHAGLPLTGGARVPVYFLVEGRLFFDGVDDIDNNYQFWGGLRVRF